jgi:hypothetical protein
MSKEYSAAEGRTKEEWKKTDYFRELMHEFITSDRFPLQEKIAAVEMFRRMDVLPEEVVDYRLRCLKGEDPGNPPDFIFNYGPTPGFINYRRPAWTQILTLYSYSEGREIGLTPDEVIGKRIVRPDEYQLNGVTARDLRGYMEAGKEMIRSYFETGANKYYPEYAPIWEAEKVKIREMQEYIDRRAKGASRRRRTDRTVDLTA